MTQQHEIARPQPRLLVRAGQRLVDGALALTRSAGDLVMPPLCLACHAPLAEHDSLCASCWSQITFLRQPLCDRLGVPFAFDMGEGAVSPRPRSPTHQPTTAPALLRPMMARCAASSTT